MVDLRFYSELILFQKSNPEFHYLRAILISKQHHYTKILPGISKKSKLLDLNSRECGNFILLSSRYKYSTNKPVLLDEFTSGKSFRESQTEISGLGRRVGQLDAGQTENTEYQEPTATRLVLPSSSSKGSLHGRMEAGIYLLGTETSPPRYAGGSPPEDTPAIPVLILQEKKLQETKKLSKIIVKNKVILLQLDFGNTILSHDFSNEYFSHHDQILNITHAHKIVGTKLYINKTYLKHRKTLEISFPSFLTKYIQKISLTDSKEFDMSIDRYIKESGSDIGGDIFGQDPEIQEFSTEGFATVLIDLWFFIAKVIPSRIANIIVDLAIQPNLYFILIQEQKDLIKKYGQGVTYQVAKEMKFMDAFIKESLNNSIPASFIFRSVLKEMFLSNGAFLSKGQMISINMFSETISNNSNTDKEFDICRHIANKKSFTEPSMDSLIWGYGVQYSGTLIKIFVALLIRKLYIFSNIDGNQPVHPGYINLSTVIPSVNSVYFKLHDINGYRDLIDLTEEYNRIMNSNSQSIV
ncbi:hypothetical protein BB560_004562 [Smittium megazygosporum]|uniref:Uncharacterized protein n=1 Tax=Smittium megazygosporum TaxID=133381 RepID=A0A2T9Z8W1_9FUNG|nr:hypothetical protein BB560_004562 [Smittium megazygosporum]